MGGSAGCRSVDHAWDEVLPYPPDLGPTLQAPDGAVEPLDRAVARLEGAAFGKLLVDFCFFFVRDALPPYLGSARWTLALWQGNANPRAEPGAEKCEPASREVR